MVWGVVVDETLCFVVSWVGVLVIVVTRLVVLWGVDDIVVADWVLAIVVVLLVEDSLEGLTVGCESIAGGIGLEAKHASGNN